MDSNFDPDAQAAIEELASLLGPAITEAIGSAIRASLGEIDGTLKKHNGEIRTAANRVEEMFADLEKGMRAKAGTALSDGIQQKVIPAIAEECRKLAQELVRATESRLESAQRTVSAIEGSVRELEGQVVTKLESNGARAELAIATARGAIAAAIEENARRSHESSSASAGALAGKIESLSHASEEQMKGLREGLHVSSSDVKEALRSGLREEAGATKSQIAGVERALTGVMDKNTEQLNKAWTDQVRGMEGLWKGARDRGEVIAEELRKALRQILLVESETKKEILSGVTQGAAICKQGFSEVSGAVCNLQKELGGQMDADRKGQETTGQSIVDQIGSFSTEQRRLARQVLVLEAVILLLMVTTLVLVLNRHGG